MKAVKTKSGKYQARGYNKHTNTQKCFTADTKKEAERLARAYQYAVNDSANEMTLEEASALYIETHRNIWSSAQTEQDYKGFEKHYDYLLKMKLDSITDTILQERINEESAIYSAKTIKNVYSHLKTLKKLYGHSPVIKVDMPKIGKPILIPPTEEDVAYLMSVAEESNEEYSMAVPVYLAAFGCLRRSEVAALDIDHIDFKNRLIHVEYSMTKKNGEWIRKFPKNTQSRLVNAPQIVFDKIKEYGLPDLNPTEISKNYSAMRTKYGTAGFRFHDLRHFCAARMMGSLGIGISIVQEYGGWEDQTVLLKIYNYVIKEVKEDGMAKWNAFANDFEKTSRKLVEKRKNP